MHAFANSLLTGQKGMFGLDKVACTRCCCTGHYCPASMLMSLCTYPLQSGFSTSVCVSYYSAPTPSSCGVKLCILLQRSNSQLLWSGHGLMRRCVWKRVPMNLVWCTFCAQEYARQHGFSTDDLGWLFATRTSTNEQRRTAVGAWTAIAERLPHRRLKAVWAAGTRLLHAGNFLVGSTRSYVDKV